MLYVWAWVPFDYPIRHFIFRSQQFSNIYFLIWHVVPASRLPTPVQPASNCKYQPIKTSLWSLVYKCCKTSANQKVSLKPYIYILMELRDDLVSCHGWISGPGNDFHNLLCLSSQIWGNKPCSGGPNEIHVLDYVLLSWWLQMSWQQ